MRIMIIEDDRDIMDAVEGVLEFGEYAFDFIESENGQVALRALQNLADHDLPDLIILDVAMPVMNGFEFREAQMQDNRLANIPVLVVSAGHWTSAMLMQIYPDFYLDKPINTGRLDEIINAVAGKINERSVQKTKH